MSSTARRTTHEISDLALARHFVDVAELTALEGDSRLAQHLLDLAHDLFGQSAVSTVDIQSYCM